MRIGLTIGLTLALAAPFAPAAARAAEELTAGGPVIGFERPPLVAFLGWEKQVQCEAGGLHVRAPNCQGGAGYRLAADLSALADRTPALTVTLGEGNKAESLHLQLQDADGTRPGSNAGKASNRSLSLQVPSGLNVLPACTISVLCWPNRYNLSFTRISEAKLAPSPTSCSYTTFPAFASAQTSQLLWQNQASWPSLTGPLQSGRGALSSSSTFQATCPSGLRPKMPQRSRV